MSTFPCLDELGQRPNSCMKYWSRTSQPLFSLSQACILPPCWYFCISNDLANSLRFALRKQFKFELNYPSSSPKESPVSIIFPTTCWRQRVQRFSELERQNTSQYNNCHMKVSWDFFLFFIFFNYGMNW